MWIVYHLFGRKTTFSAKFSKFFAIFGTFYMVGSARETRVAVPCNRISHRKILKFRAVIIDEKAKI